jgi:parallel beta-helix repeat protein
VVATGVVGFMLGFALGEATPPVGGVAAVSDPPWSLEPGPTAPPGGTPGPGTFEVRADGDDAGAGDAAAPWRTLARALAGVPAGSTIRLGAGTFDAVTISVPQVRILGAGESTVITGGLQVRADGVEIREVTLTGQQAAYGGGILVDGARNVVIRSSLIRGNPFGVYLVDAPGALVTGNLITDNGYGLEIHGASGGTVVSGNEIVDNDRPVDASRRAGGLNLYFTTGGVTIANNEIADNDEVAIEIYAASDILVDGNRMSGSNDMVETGTDNDTPCRNLVFTGNTIFSSDPADGSEERGIYLRCATASRIEWNTFVGLDRFAVGLYAGTGGFNGPLDEVAIAHNVIAGGRAFSIDSPLPASVTMDHDVVMPCRSGTCPIMGREIAAVAFAGGGTTVWSEFRDWTGQEANGLFAAPRFRDPLVHDYGLLPGSPAIGLAGATERPPTAVQGASAGPAGSVAP